MSPPADEYRWDVGRLPFLWRPLEGPRNGDGLPDTLPFSATMDPATGALVQCPDPSVEAALKHAYAIGSTITGTMEEEGIGRDYAIHFLAFLKETLGRDRFEGLRVLEVGCGTGYLLSLLQGLGAEVLGVEPGEHGREGAHRYGVPIVRDFFPSAQVSGRFDLVLAYGVLEHAPDAVGLLRALREALLGRGVLALSVPNCETTIDQGDVSMFLHEHWAYYTPGTLRWALSRAGFADIRCTKGSIGDSLYAVAVPGEAAEASQDAIPSEGRRILSLRDRATRSIRRVRDFLRDAAEAGESVGVYVPGRFVNLWALGGTAPTRLRFFDDNARLVGTYFPGIPIPIESGDALLSRPTDRVLVMSWAFGPGIVERLARHGLRAVAVSSLCDE